MEPGWPLPSGPMEGQAVFLYGFLHLRGVGKDYPDGEARCGKWGKEPTSLQLLALFHQMWNRDPEMLLPVTMSHKNRSTWRGRHRAPC